MRIDFLKIPAHRNLRNFEINFDERAPMTVLLGRNGSGKSNLLEDLVEIFLTLEKGQPPRFAYQMTYYCYGQQIKVEANPSKTRNRLSIHVNGEKLDLTDFRSNVDAYLPINIFVYYSGWNTRLEKLFSENTKRFIDLSWEGTAEDSGFVGLRRFFLCRKEYAQFALLTLFFVQNEFAKELLEKYLGIYSFESALFVLKAPWRSERKNHDEFFWGVEGDSIAFLERLRRAALAPIKNSEDLEVDVRGRKQTVEKLYLYIRDKEHLDKLLAPFETPKIFFNNLENLYLLDILDEIRIVYRNKLGERVSISQLSEGEQQLVTVFGLLLFTQQDETLFLLDEPDSHLNPRWVYDYLELLRRAFLTDEEAESKSDKNPLRGDVEPTVHGASQLILATHNPLIIGRLQSRQVRLMTQLKDRTLAEEPDFDPIGTSIEGLIKSELFGLPSSLPPEILADIDIQNQLQGLSEHTPEQEELLQEATERLNQHGILVNHPNPLFDLFAKAAAQQPIFQKPNLSKEELQRQEILANQILDKILAENP